MSKKGIEQQLRTEVQTLMGYVQSGKRRYVWSLQEFTDALEKVCTRDDQDVHDARELIKMCQIAPAAEK